MRHQSSSPTVIDFISGSSHISDGDDDQNHQHCPHGAYGARLPELTMDPNQALHEHLAFMVGSLHNRVSRLEDKLLEAKPETSNAAAINEIKSQISQLHVSQKALKTSDELILKQLKDVVKANEVIMAGIDSILAKLDNRAKAVEGFKGRAERQLKDDVLPASKRNLYDFLSPKFERFKRLNTLERSGLDPDPYEEMYEDIFPRQRDAPKAQSNGAYSNLSGLHTGLEDKEEQSATVSSITAAEKLTSLKNTPEVPDHSPGLPVRKKMDPTLALPRNKAPVRQGICPTCSKVNCTARVHGLPDRVPSTVVPRAPYSLADIHFTRIHGTEPMDP
ncbi:hypothetical protein PpBr36_00785 [Pyricularia pennisetigena]|uniref:hypothetical protein n=1 Tax=Pyricularia pennisetigena TaxID=1578925 RepID=UPI00114FBE7B|nr:hypothetical protein PpBr36_00785 [Pyricularia pennisetigena]TLS28321.1 hypothetical protein PpBr36_00785 [Pyricularia pennisetigena]